MQFVRLLQVSGIFYFVIFHFLDELDSSRLFQAFLYMLLLYNQWGGGINELVLFLSQAFVCLSCHLPFVFLLEVIVRMLCGAHG